MPTEGKPGKRIIIACDGTWLSSDNGLVKGRLPIDSNITRFCRALKASDSANVPQIIYYQSGLGSEDNVWSSIVGGYLGQGFGEHVREAYSFLCNNYVDGDEIYLLGFSRGAFTARSIGGLISAIGLLNNRGLPDFYSIFLDWENQTNPTYVNELKTQTFAAKSKRPSFKNGAYLASLLEAKLTRVSPAGYIPITAIGVWDTVGTLGVPELTLLPPKTRHEFSFVNTEVAPNVAYAFQALALDERRKPFSPTVWEHPAPGTPTRLKLLKQTWFPGVHSNIGNAYPDAEIGDLTLAWMIDCVTPLGLAFDHPFLDDLFAANAAWTAKTASTAAGASIRPENIGWGKGKLYSSDGITDWITGSRVRTPGQYHWTDPDTGVADPKRLLAATREYVHASVRVRRALGGLGTDNKGTYAPDALKGWVLYAPGQAYKGGANPWQSDEDARWKWVLDKGDMGRPVYICEDVMERGGVAAGQLEKWPKAREEAGSAVVDA